MVRPFNLSILECKLRLCDYDEQTEALLISPYWNVNVDTGKYRAGWSTFNLSILECKYYVSVANNGYSGDF